MDTMATTDVLWLMAAQTGLIVVAILLGFWLVVRHQKSTVEETRTWYRHLLLAEYARLAGESDLFQREIKDLVTEVRKVAQAVRAQCEEHGVYHDWDAQLRRLDTIEARTQPTPTTVEEIDSHLPPA